MKRFGIAVAILLALAMTVPAFGAEFAFHGDLNNRFTLYTNQSGFFSGAGEQNIPDGTAANDAKALKKDGVSGYWGNIKYRLWTEAATNDGNVKGVVAIEMGGLNYGDESKGAGGFSGDGIVLENRWTYTDLQLPFVESKSRLRLGLQPFKANYYLWNETAMGVNWYGGRDIYDYQLAWIRGFERFRTATSGGDNVDSFLGRVNVKPMDGLKGGLFVVYTNSRASDRSAVGAITGSGYLLKTFSQAQTDIQKWDLGIDGNYKTDVGPGNLFFNWDLIYQGGTIGNASMQSTNLTAFTPSNTDKEFDLKAYFAHLDVGFGWDDFKLTYTFWYASGDDKQDDNDLKGYVATDLDVYTGGILFGESYDDDKAFSERHYLLDKGMLMNKLAFDHKATDRLTWGLALAYMKAAEDVEYNDGDGSGTGTSTLRKNDGIGTEVSGYASYKLYKNVEFAVNAGYWLTDDAMDLFEEESIRNGKADEDIFRSMARIRYKF